jgi:tetratricopeptide (TPR) repeat protein
VISPALPATAKDSAPRDEAQALQWAEDALKAKRVFTDITVNSQYILYRDAAGNRYGIALARIGGISMSGRADIGEVSWRDYSHEGPESVEWLVLFGGGHRAAEKFKSALEFLAERAHQHEADQQAADFAQFQVQAKAWRDAPAKPAMPAAAHEHQVLAEYAFKEKDTDKAINEYTSALAIDPCWPEGQFNLATLAGEKKLYAIAVFHMKEYLELVPNSPDATAAQDSVIIWKDKLQTLMAAAGNDSQQDSKKPRRTVFQQTSENAK